ncbi:unnamed protein product [Oppiella nova]|uniref:Protein sleepless n=1 Tax=Oppiella nova TaxID=334625 RepID=A0A7R9LLL7_9ACAR|nr:unnamed protein product [Oppiella nova]CAG2164763.1 unnamed protein product [Oppiella nova]
MGRQVEDCYQTVRSSISWGCDWGYNENGVYWEECYCAEDSCNGSQSVRISFPTLITAFLSLF